MSLITKPIGEIADEIKTGKTPPTKKHEYFGGEVNWYTPGDFDDSVYLGASKRTITEQAIKDKTATIFEKETVLLTCIGDIGKLGIIREPSGSNQQITGIKLSDEIYPLYFLLWCRANKVVFENRARKAVVPILNNAVLSKIKITFPSSIEDQIRIATLLSRVEALIATRKNNLQQLDDFLKSTFMEMFGDPVKNEKGWEKKPLSKLGSIDRGVSKHRPRNAPELLGGDYPLIQTGEVSNSGTYITKYKHTYSEIGFKQSKLWPAGTLCITIAANIAQTSILTFDACFPDSVVGFIPNIGIEILYVHYLFSFFQRILEKNAPKAAQRNINLAILRGLIVPDPPPDLQSEFSSLVNRCEILKDLYAKNLQELENLYATLSQKAFKGELDLSRIPLPEEDIVPEQTENTGKEEQHAVSSGVEKDFSTPTQRQLLFNMWLSDYQTAHANQPFSADAFLQYADEKFREIETEDTTPFGLADYELLKNQLFEQIRDGSLMQYFSPDNKQIELKATN